MKERVTVTIERSLLHSVDAAVDGVLIKNRSHAIELLLERSLKHIVPQRAVILAGGDAKKLLKPVQGKPVIAHNVELLAAYGVPRATIIIAKGETRIKELLGDGSAYDLAIDYVEEREPHGTAGCLNLIRDTLTDDFILMNADELKDVNLKELYAFHAERGLCTIALTNVQEPSAYGVALLNGSRIIGFIEKPPGKNPPSTLINAGLYVMSPEALAYIPRGFARLETDVFPKLAKDDKLIGYPFSGQYLDIAPGVTERLTNLWHGFTTKAVRTNKAPSRTKGEES